MVYPGQHKEIVWDYIEELVHFSAEIQLSIEVTPSVEVKEKIKKGKQLTVSLAPVYVIGKTYSVKLFQRGLEVAKLTDVVLKEKTFSVQIPPKTKVKKNYQLQLTDGEKTFFSNTFKVRRKVSLGWIVIPVVALPVYFIINQSIKDNKSLPGPPGSGFPGGN